MTAQMLQVNFVKMHGLFNSFIIISDLSAYFSNQSVKLSETLCSPQKGIGADGLVFLRNSEDDGIDFVMDFYNADGSKAEMCGNAIRCLAKFVEDQGLVSKKKEISFNTPAGIIKTRVLENQKNYAQVSVKMGIPKFTKLPQEERNQVEFKGHMFYSVNLGNPHAVTLVDHFDFDYKHIGQQLQQQRNIFPDGVNVEFAQVISPNEIAVRVIERGVGETLACGTGACAVVAHYIKKNFSTDLEIKDKLRNKKPVSVKINLQGGDLTIDWDGSLNSSIVMTGAATLVATGVFHYEQKLI